MALSKPLYLFYLETTELFCPHVFDGYHQQKKTIKASRRGTFTYREHSGAAAKPCAIPALGEISQRAPVAAGMAGITLPEAQTQKASIAAGN